MKRLLLLLLLLGHTASAQTLSPESEARLRALCEDPKLTDARVGVSILALGRADSPQSFPSQALAAPKTLFERDAEKRFMPASNMKLYTAALALKSLAPGRRFTTRIRAVGKIERGVLYGNLVLEGSGDPSLDFADVDDMAKQVSAAGIRKITMGLAVAPNGPARTYGFAENLFNLYPDGWTMDDGLWYYGPPIVGLTLHRNQIDLTVTGGARPGDPAAVALESGVPANLAARENFSRTYVKDGMTDDVWVPMIEAYDVSTGEASLESKDADELLRADRQLGSASIIHVTGKVAPRQKVTIGLAIPEVGEWVTGIFQERLAALGIVCDRSAHYQISDDDGAMQSGKVPSRIVATHDSPPVGVLLKKFLKSSDNLYGELLLRLAARADLTVRGRSLHGVNYAKHGHDLLRTYLKTEGIDTGALRFSDGSGLSRYNLLTPRATTQLLAAAERLPGGQFFWDALPIAGVDGTLRNRMKATPAQNNVRAKTGTFSIASCLSGYVTTKDGTRLAVAVFTNFARQGDDARRVQNEIFATLADASLLP